MTRVRVHNFSMSLDGFAAGPEQSLDDPLGVGGERLHEWAVATSAFKRMQSGAAGDAQDRVARGSDDDFISRGDDGIGATIMGRNMFGPVRGPWGKETWTGWWGPNPPFHHDVYVLTHHARPSVPMAGGTTFHFVTDGVQAALEQAAAAAGARDIRLGGGVATIQQFLRAGLVDELHIAVVPILLGRGERLFEDIDGAPDYDCAELVSSPAVTHVRLVRSGS